MARNNRRDMDDDFGDFSGRSGNSGRSGSSGGYGKSGRSGSFDDWEDKDPMELHDEPKPKFNIVMLLISIVLAPVIWPLCMFLYEILVESFPRALLIGMIFGLLGLTVGLAVHLTSKVAKTYQRNLSPARGAIPVVATIVIASLLMGLFGTGFQWLYQSRFKFDGPTSYIFIIDSSGSMDHNDPDNERYKAISKVLEEMDDDFPFMVYGFDDEGYLIREMAPVSEGTKLKTRDNGGLTYMKDVMDLVITDYENGKWEGGERPQVVLLTDGIANDFQEFYELTDILDRYEDNGIVLSTVGLVNSDPKMMSDIAESTGGIFVEIDDASDLLEAMSAAVNIKTNDDLLNTRKSDDMNLLLGVLRVVFILLLGALLSYIKAVAYGQGRAYKAVILTGSLQSLVGALLMELGTTLGLNAAFCWMLLWFLMILMICNKYERIGNDGKKKHRVGGDF